MLAKRLVDWEASKWTRWLTKKEVIGKREFWIIMSVYNLKQYLTERTRLRNYEERGLSKMHGEQRVEPHSIRHVGGEA